MEPDKLIDAFIKVVQEQDYVFNLESIHAIPSLLNKLTQLQRSEDFSIGKLAKLISQWYINYESVRDAILVTEREISKVKKANTAAHDNFVENRYPIIQEELKKLHDKKKKDSQNK